LFANKFVGSLLFSVGAFPIKREGSDVSAMRECLRKLKSGQPLALFPTGTRVVGDEAISAKAGVGFLAVKGGVPVIPLQISGTDQVMPKGVSAHSKTSGHDYYWRTDSCSSKHKL
jgi:1-acyl-sn-glycerol-3-phosphate acyltransferase